MFVWLLLLLLLLLLLIIVLFYLFCRCWYFLLLGLLIFRPCILSSLQNAASVITKCDKWYYKSATEHGSQHCCDINCILNIAVSIIRLRAHVEKLLWQPVSLPKLVATYDTPIHKDLSLIYYLYLFHTLCTTFLLSVIYQPTIFSYKLPFYGCGL